MAISSGHIQDNRLYAVSGDAIVYNGVTYQPGERFRGAQAVTDFSGSGTVDEVSELAGGGLEFNFARATAFPADKTVFAVGGVVFAMSPAEEKVNDTTRLAGMGVEFEYDPALETGCIAGPYFALSGNTYYTDQSVAFQLVFGSAADQEQVLAYEWFLDGILLTAQNIPSFSKKVSCGRHTIGVRILTDEGWSGVKKTGFQTCMTLISVAIEGENYIDPGNSAVYRVLRTYAHGVTEDISAQYQFSTSAGTMNGPVLSVAADATGLPAQALVTATKAGSPSLSKTVDLPKVTLSGPLTVDQTATATFVVKRLFLSGNSTDITTDYLLSSPDGSFIGGVFTPGVNTGNVASREAQIFASKANSGLLTFQLTITDNAVIPGVLVVDIFNDVNGHAGSLNVIGIIDNPEVSGNHIAAYTGHNIVPSGASPSNALVLASDFVTEPGSLKWRFEFNLEKLTADYPALHSFTFYIKGRADAAYNLNGVFGLKTIQAEMILPGSPGSYVPSTSGGSNIGQTTSYNSDVFAGANGSYAEDDLHTIIEFIYNKDNRTVQYFTYLDNPDLN